MHAVIAQGEGFCGMAFFTSELPLAEIERRLKPSFSFLPSGSRELIFEAFNREGRVTFLRVCPWQGEPQPLPVALGVRDPSHEDLRILKVARALL